MDKKCSRCSKPLEEKEGVEVYYYCSNTKWLLCWDCWEKFCLDIIKYRLEAKIVASRHNIEVDFELGERSRL